MDGKNILVGLTYYYPNISGVSLYAVILAEELVKRNYKVTVLTSKHQKGLETHDKKEGVEIFRLNGFSVGKGFIMPGYAARSYEAVRRAEVVICNLPSIESIWLAIWARIFNKKLIVIHHCEFGFDGPMANKLIGVLSYPIHFITYLLADTIVSYTRDYADHSMFLKQFKRKVIYILPPIKIKPFPQPLLRINRTPKPLTGQGRKHHYIVGYVGRIAWEKGLNLLIEAMKQVDAKLMLVGPYLEVAGDKTYKSLGKVELVGPVEHEKLNDYYSKFDCLVLPSTNNLETFGIVQAEAMKCGCPVVASNLPGVRVPVRMTGMGEVAEVGDIDDLADKINLVLQNGKKYYQKKAENLEKFDYLNTVDEFEKCIKL